MGIRARSAGTATITATDGRGQTVTMTVNVGENTNTTATGAPVYAGKYEPLEKANEMPMDGTSVNGVVLDYDENMEDRLELIQLVNEFRRENGLNELKIAENIMVMAQADAWDDAWQGVVDHRCSNWISRDDDYLYSCTGNLTNAKYSTAGSWAQTAFNAFYNSPGHRAQMLDEYYDYVGAGMVGRNCALYFWSTEILVNPDGWLELAKYDPLLH